MKLPFAVSCIRIHLIRQLMVHVMIHLTDVSAMYDHSCI